MSRLKAGDAVRVGNASGSPWQASLGTVVEVFDREGALQECAVRIDGNLRWFMAHHLVRTVPPKWLRYFRNEVMERWRLNPDQTCGMNGDREQLLELLRDQCAFSIRRAEAEVDDFYAKLDETTWRAEAEKFAPLSFPQSAA